MRHQQPEDQGNRLIGLDYLRGFVVILHHAVLAYCRFGHFDTRHGFERRFAVWDSLSANAYGIYLLHYRFVAWGQYALLDADIGAIPKAAGVFTGALGLSWCGSAVLHR